MLKSSRKAPNICSYFPNLFHSRRTQKNGAQVSSNDHQYLPVFQQGNISDREVEIAFYPHFLTKRISNEVRRCNTGFPRDHVCQRWYASSVKYTENLTIWYAIVTISFPNEWHTSRFMWGNTSRCITVIVRTHRKILCHPRNIYRDTPQYDAGTVFCEPNGYLFHESTKFCTSRKANFLHPQYNDFLVYNCGHLASKQAIFVKFLSSRNEVLLHPKSWTYTVNQESGWLAGFSWFVYVKSSSDLTKLFRVSFRE